MRPGQHQQNRRGRGRNNNNGNSGGHSGNAGRKGQNPLSRSFESNGPDVKVRGTPAHIAEKYLALARDAQSSGDRVLAENYLQHAEHYNRIIMAYREQFQTPGEQPQRRAPGMEGFDEMGDDDLGNEGGEDFGGGPQPGAAMGVAPTEGQGNPAPQQRPPYRQDNRYDNRNEGRFDRNGDNQNRGDRPFRRDGQPNNNRFRDRNDRNDRNQNRPYQPNGNNGNDRGPNDRPYENRGERNEGRQEPRPENRGDFRQDRGPRPDRPIRADRPEQGDRPQHPKPQSQPTAPQFEMPPAQSGVDVEAQSSLPPFVAAPTHLTPSAPATAPIAPTRRRQAPAETAVAGSEAPEFLRRPVRRTRAAVAAATPPTDAPAGSSTSSDAGDEPGSES